MAQACNAAAAPFVASNNDTTRNSSASDRPSGRAADNASKDAASCPSSASPTIDSPAVLVVP
uniref:Uncharacterized protein n=1 Tax=Janibacter limosus TaxID=53458 RepID=A0AC61U1X1_9MICO|nr:hypothetical protein [Janibacter limosus]